MSRSIRFFESQEIVRDRYKRLHGGSLSAAKARSIALHVEQGVNFIESANRAPMSIKPLLQYYGVAALARAVTIFRDPKRHEGTLTPGHGIQVLNWTSLGNDHSDRGFADLKVRTTAGLFTDLSDATKGLTHFYANSSRPNWRVDLGSVAVGTEFNFGDLLGLMPDLWPEHSAWTGVAHKQFALQEMNVTGTEDTQRMNWKIGTNESPEIVASLFSEGLIGAPTGAAREVRAVTSTEARFQLVQLHHGGFDIGDVLLVPPIALQASLSTIEIYCIMAYIMSMLCRYRLSDWLAVWRGEKGDIVRPTFERAMDLIEEQYLQIASDLMWVGTDNLLLPSSG